MAELLSIPLDWRTALCTESLILGQAGPKDLVTSLQQMSCGKSNCFKRGSNHEKKRQSYTSTDSLWKSYLKYTEIIMYMCVQVWVYKCACKHTCVLVLLLPSVPARLGVPSETQGLNSGHLSWPQVPPPHQTISLSASPPRTSVMTITFNSTNKYLHGFLENYEKVFNFILFFCVDVLRRPVVLFLLSPFFPLPT